MRRVVGLILLFILWLFLSGVYKSLLIFFGGCSVILVVFVDYYMEKKDGHVVTFDLRLWRFLGYGFFLIKEIVKSNIAVSKLLLAKEINLNQRFLNVKVSQSTEVGQVVFANSITLTPGTVTVETEKDIFAVHALNVDNETEKDLQVMNDRVSAVEK